MLELMDLSKRYKQFYAVKNMNMYIEKGEIVGLLGPNGAGKSTAISMLSSLIEPTEGDVLFHKKSILKNPSPLRKVIGVVPQEIALYEELTAEENLHFFGRIYRMSGKELRQKIDDVLKLIGLVDRRKDVVKKFSGGMKRRLNIGVALLHNPEFLIMDEPTVGIDPQSRSYILETVKRLNEEKGLTILYTSHYMEEVEYLCDRIYIMDKGNLIAVGTKDDIKEILSAEHTIHVEAELLNNDFIEALQEEPTIKETFVKDETITIIVPKEINVFQLITRLANETKVELKSVNVKTPTLEDVFLHLTGRALRD
ncbi:ATP-binding cassette domain-containing protein [Pseudogracilibacillus auburnensis]|uniref:ABC-2 type transport system ATP-binding protein n=1 Tax=Pseudogracilibacillus auburnensis TaxID=1494959 RepID=A0A2V3VY82_9BACI|nr:ABC transporter ATP-binding protein [Pseudogracilibacillus auburnensis]MBO1005357.1 ABC transporter ATP-binding protein [Pseudogracilibacillus auburnensis]PXW86967.1 ABC-2 type transport system ATP-binding protein [Pseudogracilibacillus auburnensis]